MREKQNTVPLELIGDKLKCSDDYDTVESRSVVRILFQNAGLSSRQKEVVGKLFIEGYSQEEIAGMMGVSSQAVSNYKEKALKKLRRARRRGEKEGWF